MYLEGPKLNLFLSNLKKVMENKPTLKIRTLYVASPLNESKHFKSILIDSLKQDIADYDNYQWEKKKKLTVTKIIMTVKGNRSIRDLLCSETKASKKVHVEDTIQNCDCKNQNWPKLEGHVCCTISELPLQWQQMLKPNWSMKTKIEGNPIKQLDR